MHDFALATQVSRLQALPRFYDALLLYVCSQIVQVLQTATPGTTLPQQWTARIQKTADGAVGVIWNQREVDDPEFSEIMVYLDMGTSAHWIAPVRAKVLSWVEQGVRYFSAGHEVRGIAAAHFDSQAKQRIAAFDHEIPWLLDRYLTTGELP
jgi:hypothetical protein